MMVTSNPSIARLASSTAHRDHDLQPIAVEQLLLRELSARHDLTITLQGDAFAGELQVLDQLSDGEGGLEAARLAVDDQCDHAV